jgi:hypothetical protein
MRMHTPARAEVNQHILAVVKESKDIKHDVVRFDIAVAYAAQPTKGERQSAVIPPRR